MEVTILEIKQQKIAEVIADDIVINTAQDALDMMVEAGYYDARSVILYEQNIHPDFFELQTGLAGEILQKYVNYQMKLAVVGTFEKFESKSLQAFIIESNKGNLAFFVPDRDTAIAKLTPS
ncbi:MAG: DUF4180 domain-containing protein [Anaerolineae bacterium]|nr:DUF4180 domain-containing protein [Anaerolineae bacterium]